MVARVLMGVAVLCVMVNAAHAVTDCGDYATCDECKQNTECGWCAASNACMAGNNEGPTSLYCEPWSDDGQTSWMYEGCPDCSDYSGDGCTTCTTAAHCGWCKDTASCVAGTDSGPVVADNCFSSDSGGWAWYSDSCCSENLSCSACTSQMYCGWCDETDSCYSGDSNGPNGENICFEDWEYDSGSCDTAWTVGGVGFWLCYIVLPILCFVICVRGCVYYAYRRRLRRRYRPLATGGVVTGAVAGVAVAGAYQQAGGYQQQQGGMPPQQVPPGYQTQQQYATAPPTYQQQQQQPYYATNTAANTATPYQQPTYQAAYTAPPPANLYGSGAAMQPEKDELPPPTV